jgi:4-hydroxybenzoate polyprenyltransferase
MKKQKNFFESMMGETPIAPDLFWGTLALLVFVLVQIVFEFTRWSAWFILGAGMVSVLFVIEVRRLRIPLLPKYRSTQKVSLIIIFCMVIVCIVSFFRMMLN